MAAYAAVPSYLRSRRDFDARRAMAFAVIGLLHVAALAALFVSHHADDTQKPAPALMVSFIAQVPPQPQATPPPPPEPVKPKPQPKMVATPKPSPSPISAPPIEEAPVDDAKVEEAPPAPPSPPAAPAPPAVVPPDFVAAYLNNPGPKYPALSMKMREQGTVMLLVLVNPQGRADKVTVETSSGHARLDEAAVEVVRERWRFVPAKQGDQAVSAWVKVPITFKLHQR